MIYIKRKGQKTMTTIPLGKKSNKEKRRIKQQERIKLCTENPTPPSVSSPSTSKVRMPSKTKNCLFVIGVQSPPKVDIHTRETPLESLMIQADSQVS